MGTGELEARAISKSHVNTVESTLRMSIFPSPGMLPWTLIFRLR